MILSIPLRHDIWDYEQRTELDALVFLFRFRYNSRIDMWFMDLYQSDGTVLITGIPIVINWFLLKMFANANLPQGDIFAVNIIEENTEITEMDLGDNALLLYNEAE